jgi:hypothetical protein
MARSHRTRSSGRCVPAIDLAARYDPVELIRIGFRMYEKFRPEIPFENTGWGAKAELQLTNILAAT